ncbi:HAD-IC family P-type ATPase [Plasticicumulans acidivorans]|uniref:Calcium-translocating P-type ATPase n=1 Tax=Plasticicumulans acidivorans TaxID=886464 RepID=A0A317MZW1_9GAMM|nr:HAD-IC family P-type ATPase [Plasticicumulans acidivorans]PWV64656.1 calcium-translocating P-type ATPase [Plasticicumulans acidivorans]
MVEQTTVREAPQRPWHACSSEEALTALDSSPRGLAEAEAAARLRSHGANRLAPPRPVSPLLRFLRQFDNVLIYVLLASAVTSVLLGHYVDATVILAVTVLNALVGFIQEGKAESALAAIRNMLSPHALVYRDGHRREIAAEALVPGDVVLLSSGDKVPADLRLLHVKNLRVQEAALTGEAEAVDKHAAAIEAAATLGDRSCMAYSGTLIATGQAAGLVIATGTHTEIGRISTLLARVGSTTTPLLEQINRFGRWLTLLILAIAAATFAVGALWRGYALSDMFMAAVGLAVAAIPEGLPAIMSITFALGMQRMAAHHAIVRRMPAVETLGSVTVICSDKTGTLTQNAMTVKSLSADGLQARVDGVGYAPQGAIVGDDGQPLAASAQSTLQQLARIAELCNDAQLRERDGAWQVEGDPTEGALLCLARKAGLDTASERSAWPRLDSIPFESEHRYMATLHASPHGGAEIYVKGAPEAVLAMCASQRRADGDSGVLDAAVWQAHIDALAARGQRVLALARCALAEVPQVLTPAQLHGCLQLVGLLGIMDPPRPEAMAAVQRCQSAGVRVKMITGDHAATACAIAHELGIGRNGRVLSGAEIETLDEAALRAQVREVDVYARASPEHKLRLVSALQAEGEVVAMTGDGVNDAPALKRADVGVAMGDKGTEAAKEAAAVVLADDNFATIARAVEEGRTIYDNLKKAIVFSLPTNGAQACVILAAILFGVSLPITPVQILWVNMVVAVALSLALAFEPAEADVMSRPPRRRDAALIDGFLAWRVALVSVVQTIGCLLLYLNETAAGVAPEAARTLAVNSLVVGQIFYLFNSRYTIAPSSGWAGLTGNRVALLGVGTLLLLQLAFTYAPPMQALLGTAALGLREWLMAIGVGFSVYVVVELEKWTLRRRLARHAA